MTGKEIKGLILSLVPFYVYTQYAIPGSGHGTDRIRIIPNPDDFENDGVYPAFTYYIDRDYVTINAACETVQEMNELV